MHEEETTVLAEGETTIIAQIAIELHQKGRMSGHEKTLTTPNLQ